MIALDACGYGAKAVVQAVAICEMGCQCVKSPLFMYYSTKCA